MQCDSKKWYRKVCFQSTRCPPKNVWLSPKEKFFGINCRSENILPQKWTLHNTFLDWLQFLIFIHIFIYSYLLSGYIYAYSGLRTPGYALPTPEVSPLEPGAGAGSRSLAEYQHYSHLSPHDRFSFESGKFLAPFKSIRTSNYVGNLWYFPNKNSCFSSSKTCHKIQNNFLETFSSRV